jgi:hypothetical protein
MSQRTIFQSNSIEFTPDIYANKKAIIEAIGHLFMHAGRAILDAAEDSNSQIPRSFDLIKEVDGWDMQFKMKLNLEEPSSQEPNK